MADLKTEKTYANGLIDGRKEGAMAERIQLTNKHLRQIMSYFGVDLETAMIALQLPRENRKTYRKIWEKSPKKQTANKKI